MTPAVPESTPPRRVRPVAAEWFFAAAFSAIGLWIYFHTPIRWDDPEVLLYRNLGLAFFEGFAIMIPLTYGEALLRGVPAGERRTWRWLAGAVAGAVALSLYLSFDAPQSTPLNRLLECVALGALLTAAALTLFLPVAGLVRLRHVAHAIGESLGLWAPWLSYHVFVGYCLSATRLAAPLVWDPVLLRMDLSLGFNASRTAHAWAEAVPWIHRVSVIAYGLLGPMIAGVIAWLQIAGARAQARRALLASFLVGVLGLGCYQLVPAVGPIYAFPSLYRGGDTPALRAEAAAASEPAPTGPDRIAGPAPILRNAMPSLHAAFTLVTLAAAWNWRRRFFWQCLPIGILQILTTLLLGYHYVVDLLAAVPLAALCWWGADAAVRATPRAAEPALPGAAPGRSGWMTRLAWFAFSLVASVGGLFAWARLAPLPPGVAWVLAAIVAVAPLAGRKPDFAGVGSSGCG